MLRCALHLPHFQAHRFIMANLNGSPAVKAAQAAQAAHNKNDNLPGRCIQFQWEPEVLQRSVLFIRLNIYLLRSRYSVAKLVLTLTSMTSNTEPFLKGITFLGIFSIMC